MRKKYVSLLIILLSAVIGVVIIILGVISVNKKEGDAQVKLDVALEFQLNDGTIQPVDTDICGKVFVCNNSLTDIHASYYWVPTENVRLNIYDESGKCITDESYEILLSPDFPKVIHRDLIRKGEKMELSVCFGDLFDRNLRAPGVYKLIVHYMDKGPEFPRLSCTKEIKLIIVNQ